MKNSHEYMKYLAIVFGTFFTYKLYQTSVGYELKCIIAEEDGKTYCVRDRKNIKISQIICTSNEKYDGYGDLHEQHTSK